MKLTIALLTIASTFVFGACTSAPKATKDVMLTPCCGGGAEKRVQLQDSFAPGGRVVRLKH